jgi:hypothetical protein
LGDVDDFLESVCPLLAPEPKREIGRGPGEGQLTSDFDADNPLGLPIPKTVSWEDVVYQESCVQKLVELGASLTYASDLVGRSTQEHYELLVEQAKTPRRKILQLILRNDGGFRASETEGLLGKSHTRRISDFEDSGLVLLRERYQGELFYRLSPEEFEARRSGREPWSRAERNVLLKAANHQCALCPSHARPGGILHLDHRIPYRVDADIYFREGLQAAVQVLCAHHNNAKQQACINCENHQKLRNPDICRTCQWSGSSDFDHVAMRPEYLLPLIAKTPEEVRALRVISPQRALQVLLEAVSEEDQTGASEPSA